MLDLSRTRMGTFPETPYTGAKPVSGGALVQSVMVNNISHPMSSVAVKTATGAADEVFRGVCMTPISKETEERIFVEATITDAKTINLPGTGFTAANTKVTKADGTAVTVDGVTESEGITTIDVSTDGVPASVVNVSASRALTANEAYMHSGPSDQIAASQPINQVTRIVEGEVYTSEYDASVTWAVGDTIKLGSDGKFTNTGNGTAIKATIISIPTPNDPFLGFELSAIS